MLVGRHAEACRCLQGRRLGLTGVASVLAGEARALGCRKAQRCSSAGGAAALVGAVRRGAGWGAVASGKRAMGSSIGEKTVFIRALLFFVCDGGYHLSRVRCVDASQVLCFDLIL
jgi:hypothetical protein